MTPSLHEAMFVTETGKVSAVLVSEELAAIIARNDGSYAEDRGTYTRRPERCRLCADNGVETYKESRAPGAHPMCPRCD